MRRLASALLALALTPALAPAQTPHVQAAPAQPTSVPTFAGMPWGASDAVVVQAAAAAGLTVVGRDHDGDYELAGRVFDVPAVVYVYMSPTSGLVKVQVRLSTPEQTRGDYSRVVDTLARRYGRTEGVEVYRLPYQKGDGREDEAVRLGKGLLYSMWGDDLQPGQAALVVRATRTVVGLDYESHDWSAESDRRKNRSNGSL
jgi:hypothetical protein